jgi:hypothetical protein
MVAGADAGDSGADHEYIEMFNRHGVACLTGGGAPRPVERKVI